MLHKDWLCLAHRGCLIGKVNVHRSSCGGVCTHACVQLECLQQAQTVGLGQSGGVLLCSESTEKKTATGVGCL